VQFLLLILSFILATCNQAYIEDINPDLQCKHSLVLYVMPVMVNSYVVTALKVAKHLEDKNPFLIKALQRIQCLKCWVEKLQPTEHAEREKKRKLKGMILP